MIFEIKMVTGGHLEFLGEEGKICNNMYWAVFVPRNLLSNGGKLGSLSATIAEIWPLVCFGGHAPIIPPILGIRGSG